MSAAIVGEAIAGRSAHVRQELHKLSVGVNSSSLELAELLFEAQENNYIFGWGFPSLPAFAEKELGLKPRKAQYLARVIKVTREVGLVKEQIKSVAISKLRVITTLNPDGSFFNRETKTNESLDEHIVRLITEADDLTLKQIEAEVVRLKGMDGPNRRITRSYNTDQSTYDNVIKPAFELLRKKLGSAGRDDSGNAIEYHDGVIIEMLCADALADPNNQEPVELPEEPPKKEVVQMPMEAI
jgi:hypothetical protein